VSWLIDGPDLTEPIMRRLGFHRVSSRRARSHRRRRWGARGATIVLLFAVVGIGLQLHRHSPAARTPTGPTLPSAVRHDLLRHRTTINRALKSIRDLSPQGGIQLPANHPQAPQGNEPPNNAVGQSTPRPFRWV
jgi:hypothetical protein